MGSEVRARVHVPFDVGPRVGRARRGTAWHGVIVARIRFSDDPPEDPKPTPGERAIAQAHHALVDGAGLAMTFVPLPGNTAKELAGPLALRAMRIAEKGLAVLEAGMHDRDERVRTNAARWAVTAAPKVAALSPPDAPPSATPEERDAALRAAFESPEFCAMLVHVVAHEGGEARAALIAAGWLAPD